MNITHTVRHPWSVVLAGMALFFILTIAGCTVAIRDMSRMAYVDENIEEISYVGAGIAQLPTAGRPGMDHYVARIDTTLDRRLIESFPACFSRSAKETAQELEANEEASAGFKELVRQRLTTGAVEEEPLRVLAEALGVRYLLAVFVDDFGTGIAGSSTSYSPGYMSAGGTYIGGSVTTSAIKRKGLVGHAEILDAENGVVIWERYCEASATYNSGNFESAPTQINKYVDIFCSGIIRELRWSGRLDCDMPAPQ